jgi:hypothetical protein
MVELRGLAAYGPGYVAAVNTDQLELERAVPGRLRRRAGEAHCSVSRSGDDEQCSKPDEAAADPEEHDLWIGRVWR